MEKPTAFAAALGLDRPPSLTVSITDKECRLCADPLYVFAPRLPRMRPGGGLGQIVGMDKRRPVGQLA